MRPRHALLSSVLAVGLAATLPATAPGQPSPGTPARTAPTLARAEARGPAAPVELSVMTQNLFYGGDDYDLSTGDFCPVQDGCPRALRELADIIEASGADVVGLQETERNTGRLARRLGWFASPRAHVISRYRIVDPPHGNGVYVFVAPSPGRIVAVANVHLPSTPYGPYEVRDGATADELRAIERETRLWAIQTQLDVLPRLAARGIPVILTGDFNSPSQLDWTAAVDAVRDDVHYPFRWPVGQALARAGFVDSYREVHPDPVAVPGFTWTPGGPETDPHEVFDRIDWVLHAGPATTVDSRLVGETGGPDVDLESGTPYPSDHRGVVSTLEVTPAASPPMVALESRRVTIGGGGVVVSFHAPGKPGERIAIAAALRGGGYDIVKSHPTGPTGRTDGEVSFRTFHRIERGKYWAMLLTKDGTVLSKTPFWTYPPRTRPHVFTSRPSYREGRPITVRWTGAPGMGLDWIGLYRCERGGPCKGNGSYLLYGYTKTRIEGRLVIGRNSATLEGATRWPLRPGRYVARLLIDDSYLSKAQSPRFQVTRR